MKKGLFIFLFLAVACQGGGEAPASSESSKSLPSRQAPKVVSKDPPAPDTLRSFSGLVDLEDSLGSTYLDFGSAALILQGQFPLERNSDTLQIRELPMRFVYQKLLRSEVLDPKLELKAYLSVLEQVNQIYPYAPDDPNREDFESWKETQQHWQAWSDFKYLPLESGHYRLPMLNRGSNEDPPAALFKSLALKDTLIEYPGDMGGNKAEFLFIGKPAAYFIPRALIKVELYDGEVLKSERYLSIIFSYGC